MMHKKDVVPDEYRDLIHRSHVRNNDIRTHRLCDVILTFRNDEENIWYRR